MKIIHTTLAVILIIIASPLMLVYLLHLIAWRMAKTLTDDSHLIPPVAKG